MNHFLNKEKSATIIHDPRVIFNTLNIVNACGGNAVSSKTGHAFIKTEMRAQNAIYGGEMSAHHYFRDFNYCDSGMIPWLLVWELLSKKDISLADLVKSRIKQFPSSGELNFEVSDPEYCFRKIKEIVLPKASSVNYLDGISAQFDGWRFNLRKSNTEPLVRLNVESRGDTKLLVKKIKLLTRLILQT